MIRVGHRSGLTSIALVGLVALVGCGGAKTITVASPSGTLHAAVGNKLVITLRAQPGVGYGWELTGNRPAGLLTLESDQFKADNTGLVGGAGNEVFTFSARRAGTVVLTFHHAFRGRPLGDRRVVVVLG